MMFDSLKLQHWNIQNPGQNAQVANIPSETKINLQIHVLCSLLYNLHKL